MRWAVSVFRPDRGVDHLTMTPTEDMPNFSTDELLQFARGIRAEVRNAGLDHRVGAAAELVQQLTEVCLRESATTRGRITPVLGGAAEPRANSRLVAQL
ncbi:MAG: hypothetical protein AAGA17_10475 [Actinomycetota bacterium]